MPSEPQDTVIVVSERPIYTGAVFGGAPGPSGPTGLTGLVGATGPTGLTGATGATGLQGTAGTAGAAGAAGATGPTGLTGATGATGLQGIQGITGATGSAGSAGTAGATGATGATGSQGTAGVTGGESESYQFQTSTVNSDPGTGQIRLNNSTLANVTAIYVDNLNYGGSDVSAWLDSVYPGDTIVVRALSGPTLNYAKYTVVSVTNSTGYRTFAVTHISSGGTLPTTAAGITFNVSRTGAKGATGYTGPTGLTGATGATGLQGTAGTAGAAGAVGATGPTGLTGATGTTGATGATANTWYGDSGNPSNSLGIDGDFYLDQSSGISYKKGTATPGQWAPYTSLKGSNGAAGATGATGATGSSYISEPTIDSWTYATGTASTGLTSGNFRLNSTTDSSITTAYIHATALSSSARDALFTTTNVIGDVLYFRLISDPSVYLQFRISGTPTVASSIITVPVTYMSGDLSLGFPIGNFSISKYPSAISPLPYRVMASQKWYEAPATAASSAAASQYELRASPFYIPHTVTLDRISIDCFTGQLGGAGRIGIYSSDVNDFPSALVLDAGSVTLTTAANSSLQVVTINQTLTPGLYWLAYVNQGSGTQPSIGVFSTQLTPILTSLTSTGVRGPSARNGYIHSATVSGALPSTFTANSFTNAAIRVQVRVA